MKKWLLLILILIWGTQMVEALDMTVCSAGCNYTSYCGMTQAENNSANRIWLNDAGLYENCGGTYYLPEQGIKINNSHIRINENGTTWYDDTGANSVAYNCDSFACNNLTIGNVTLENTYRVILNGGGNDNNITFLNIIANLSTDHTNPFHMTSVNNFRLINAVIYGKEKGGFMIFGGTDNIFIDNITVSNHNTSVVNQMGNNVTIQNSRFIDIKQSDIINLNSNNITLKNNYFEDFSESAFYSSTGHDIDIINNTFNLTYYEDLSSFSSSYFPMTFNGLTFNGWVGYSNNALGVINQVAVNSTDVTIPTGSNDFNLCLIENSTNPIASGDITLFIETGGATCAGVAGAVGGTLQKQVLNALTNNGATSDYSENINEGAEGITYTNGNPSLTYDVRLNTTEPLIDVDSVGYFNITQNKIIKNFNSSLDINYYTSFYLTFFCHDDPVCYIYDNIITVGGIGFNGASNVTLCLNNQGNFIGDGNSYVQDDCGYTYINDYNNSFIQLNQTLSWVNKSFIKSFNIFYDSIQVANQTTTTVNLSNSTPYSNALNAFDFSTEIVYKGTSYQSENYTIYLKNYKNGLDINLTSHTDGDTLSYIPTHLINYSVSNAMNETQSCTFSSDLVNQTKNTQLTSVGNYSYNAVGYGVENMRIRCLDVLGVTYDLTWIFNFVDPTTIGKGGVPKFDDEGNIVTDEKTIAQDTKKGFNYYWVLAPIGLFMFYGWAKRKGKRSKWDRV